MSQVQFAQLFDVHPMTVSKWERGVVKPTPYQIGLMDKFRQAGTKPKLSLILTLSGAIEALCYLLE